MTPYEAWYGRKPSVDHLRTSVCMVHVKMVVRHTSKLADQSTPMVMIGYEAGTKAYHAYNPVNRKLVVTRDVIFYEKKSWNWSSVELVELILDEIFTIIYADYHTHMDADTGGASQGLASGGVVLLRPDGPCADKSACTGALIRLKCTYNF
jgi:hypothetical protein